MSSPTDQPAGPAAAPAARPGSVAGAVYTGLAVVGKITAVLSLIFSVIVMLVLIVIGVGMLRSPALTAGWLQVTAPSTVNSTNYLFGKGKGTASVTGNLYAAMSNGVASPSSGAIAIGGAPAAPLASQVTVIDWPVGRPAQVGQYIQVYYNAAKPSSAVTAAPRSSAAGWMYIGGGVAVGAIASLLTVLVFRFKPLAAIDGAVSILGLL